MSSWFIPESWLQEKTQWQPIETAPKNGTEFIAYSRKHGYYALVAWQEGNFCETTDYISTSNELSHWMPLPKPPEDV